MRHYWEMEATGELACEAVRWVSDEPQPGWIEVVMTDAGGRLWRFFDKPPIFSAQNITRDSSFPIPVIIRVNIIEDGDPLTVSTGVDGVESEEGEFRFQVTSSAVSR
jgi:hypothetical protein